MAFVCVHTDAEACRVELFVNTQLIFGFVRQGQNTDSVYDLFFIFYVYRECAGLILILYFYKLYTVNSKGGGGNFKTFSYGLCCSV